MEKYEEIDDPDILNELKKYQDEKPKEKPKKDDDFEEEDSKGEKAMSVLPFQDAIVEPDKHPKINTAEPSANYKLDYAYGYNCEESRQNCHYTPDGKITYPLATLGVVLDPKANAQTFFGGISTDSKSKFATSTDGQHTEEILTMGISKDRKYCITGQKGKTPKIMIWDVESKALVSKFVLPSGTRGVSAVGFSSDRSLFACTDLHNDHNVYVGDVQTGKVLFQDKGGVDKIFDLAWCKKEGSKLFLTVGVKHIKMWDAVSKKVNKGVYG
jgi:microtubule-associated protein-like 6